MQNILVSIIIPVYKVEQYIIRCIDSVLHQTYRNLEVILVDDCSPDHSMEKAHQCIDKSPLSKDLQFKYLKHDHNRGLSAARNTGIDAAAGEYVYFLDSDDEITPDCMESFLKIVERYPEVDMVQGATISKHEISVSLSLTKLKKQLQSDMISDRILVKKLILDFSRSPVTAWNKLVRRELILQNKIFFYEGIIHEDNMWAFWLSKYVQSIAYNYQPTYFYRINPDGITGNKSRKSAKSRLTIIQEELSHLSRERFERKVEIQAILYDLCGYLMREKVNPVKLIRVPCPTMISLYISNNVKRLGTTAHSIKGLYYRVVHHALNIILINIL